VRVSGRAAGLVLSLGLICGCSQQSAATDDLIHALSEAHSAIASSILAIELYDQQRCSADPRWRPESSAVAHPSRAWSARCGPTSSRSAW
jgi:hypothetical protein